MKSKFKFSYHWIVFAIGFLMIFTALGFNSTVKSTYLKAITEQLDLKRGLFSLNDTIRYAATAILNIFFGALVLRFGVRKLIAAGFLSLTAYCVISAVGTTYIHFFIASVFLGMGFAWTTTTIVGVLVEKWFTNGKGTVMGVILAANGIGGAFAEQIIPRILFGMNFELSVSEARWRLGFWITAVILIVVGGLSVLLIRNTPQEIGLEPLGANAVDKKKHSSDWDGFEYEDVKKKKYFYIIGICVFLTGFCLNSFTGYSKPHMQDVEVSMNLIAVIYSVSAIILTFSKILAGFFFDKFGIRFTFGYCSVAAIISLFALCITNDKGVVAPWVYGVMAPIALPLETIMIPLLVSELFGRRCHAKITGIYLGLNTFGYAAGPPAVNLFFDHFGSYREIFFIFGVVLLVNLTVIQFVFHTAKKDRVTFEKEDI